jgi:hypothetical protein
MAQAHGVELMQMNANGFSERLQALFRILAVTDMLIS